jgi:hypothetical protein
METLHWEGSFLFFTFILIVVAVLGKGTFFSTEAIAQGSRLGYNTNIVIGHRARP